MMKIAAALLITSAQGTGSASDHAQITNVGNNLRILEAADELTAGISGSTGTPSRLLAGDDREDRNVNKNGTARVLKAHGLALKIASGRMGSPLDSVATRR
jgi:hypothetical protein